jgi:S-adenosylmethionine:tRNA ribosyltransferase-isomerase
MRRSDFAYDLPEELIAQEPLAERSASRLLRVDGAIGAWSDHAFRDLPGLLNPGDLLVFNDTRVIPARIFGRKDTGGRVEVLIERAAGERTALAQVRASKTPRPGTRIQLEGGAAAEVTGREGDLFRLALDQPVFAVLEAHGHMPLPPYIRRSDGPADRERYQTIFAREPGAVAAPTAGLHFDPPMMARLEERGIRTARVTLHVGAGTFQPVREDDLSRHTMHAERARVDASVCAAVREAKAGGGRVVAVGTTVVRSLESAAAGGELEPWEGETRLFIRPGYRFRAVDALITNFHLPESTLLMLVSAFAGTGTVLSAYRHAVDRRYRFFSYGDAMLVFPDPVAGR